MKLTSIKLRFFYFPIVIFFFGACGNHGKIKSYDFDTSKYNLDSAFQLLFQEDSSIKTYIAEDDTTYGREGYFHIIITNNNSKIDYWMHYYSDKLTWDIEKNTCRVSIIGINGKIDKRFSFFSAEKREGVQIFEDKILVPLKVLIKNNSGNFHSKYIKGFSSHP